MTDERKFLVGVGKTIITPPLGTLLYGYGKERPASSVHDDLTATAAVFSDGTTKAAVVSLTVCSVTTEICERLSEVLKKETGITHFIFGATHTHSGPAVETTAGWGTQNSEYVDEILIPQTIKAVTSADASMRAAELGIGETLSEVGVNRREIKENGSVALGVNPWGVFDRRMRVIDIRDIETKRTILTMVHYGAHGTAAGIETDITRDWSGIMTDRLEALTEAPSMFLLGAEGDVAPRYSGPVYLKDGTMSRDRISQTEELGGKAACDAASAYARIKSYTIPKLSAIQSTIALSYKPLESTEFAESKIAAYAGRTDTTAVYETKYWQSVLEASKRPPEDAMRYSQTMIRLGDIVFVAHPFEIFSQIALRLAEYSPFEYTLSMANANGTFGYLPNKDEISRGGYEIWNSRYRYPYMLTDDADTELVTQSLKILRDEFEG